MLSRVRETTNVDFDLTYNEYAAGFGNPSASYWLGLENLYTIIQSYPTKQVDVRFDLTDDPVSSVWYQIYKGFTMGSNATSYQITVPPGNNYGNADISYIRGFNNHN